MEEVDDVRAIGVPVADRVGICEHVENRGRCKAILMAIFNLKTVFRLEGPSEIASFDMFNKS